MTKIDVLGRLRDRGERELVAAVEELIAALRNARSIIGLMDEQIGQMEGMFDDDDGQIAEAREEGDHADAEIAAILERFAS